jgi:hypothetical protein
MSTMDSHNSSVAADDDHNELNINGVGLDYSSVDQSSTAQVTTPSIVSTPTMSTTGADSQAQHADVDMDDGDYHDMPGLQDVSDSSDSDSDVDVREVEMQTMHIDDDPPLFPLNSSHSPRPSSPLPSAQSNSNRRARVEDDEDDDRDRRHPFHRMGGSAPQAQTQPQSASGLPAFIAGGDLPIRLLWNMMSNNLATPENNTDIPTAQTPAQQASPQPPQNGNNQAATVPDGFSLPVNAPSVPSQPSQPGAGGETPAATQANPNQVPLPSDTLHDVLGRLRGMLSGGGPFFTIPLDIAAGFDAPEVDDPELARKLVDGLEEVPVGLVRRLVRVGGTGGGMGHDENRGGDAGCAICWDTLLDSEGEGFGKQQTMATEEVSSSPPDLETKQRKIVNLPCAHVFHADCLIPWFSRPKQTTCPTCRFNIDPDDLTYLSWRRRQRERAQEQATHPMDDSPPVAETNTPGDGPQVAVGGDSMNGSIPPIPTSNPSAPTASPTAAEAVPQPRDVSTSDGPGQQNTRSFQTPHGFVTFTQVLGPFGLDRQAGNLGPPNAPPVPQDQAPNPGPVPQPQSGVYLQVNIPASFPVLDDRNLTHLFIHFSRRRSSV